MSGKKSRNKGKTGERELAALLRCLGFNARRGQQFSGANGDADVVGLPNIHIECKRTETFRLYDALEQAKADARQGEIPVVMHRRNARRWIVVLDLEDFIEMYKKSDYCEWILNRKAGDAV